MLLMPDPFLSDSNTLQLFCGLLARVTLATHHLRRPSQALMPAVPRICEARDLASGADLLAHGFESCVTARKQSKVRNRYEARKSSYKCWSIACFLRLLLIAAGWSPRLQHASGKSILVMHAKRGAETGCFGRRDFPRPWQRQQDSISAALDFWSAAALP